MALQIRTVRTAAVLLEAAETGVLADLDEAYRRLKTTNFRVPHEVLDALLEIHRQHQRQR